jgi:ankyrin repeat-rich membrane spanning protein
MTEDSILGYDLYSSALAEILSEPSLHTPITVGLYAKWGSGKSFLISQLKEEMKSFAKLTNVVNLKIDTFLVFTVLICSILFAIPALLWHWQYGVILFSGLSALSFFIIGIIKYFYEKKEKDWAEKACHRVSNQVSSLKLLLRILFLNPFTYQKENLEHKNLRFIFTEYGKISTIGGESALALMISSMYSKMEMQLGVVLTRLCRVFHTKAHSHSKYKRVCCIPSFLIVIAVFMLILSLAVFVRNKGLNFPKYSEPEKVVFVTITSIILIVILLSSLTWSRIAWNILRSPGHLITNAFYAKNKQNLNDNKNESFVFKLKREVDLIAHTVRTIDAFTHSCTRLVIMIDGLDSCEQSRVLQVLEIIHVLFTKEADPFLCILAVDPHVLIKGIEGNLTTVFRNGNLNGHDYLRTIIHLPIYLQVDLSKAKALSKNISLMPNKRASTTVS